MPDKALRPDPGFAASLKSADQQSIDQLNAQIKSLQAKIAAYNVQITDLAIALGATALGTVGGIALFPAFAPFILFFGLSAAIGEATALGVIEKDKSDAQSQLNGAQTQVANLQRQLDQISAANATLHSISVTTLTMDAQLGAFRDIWNSVAGDCDSVGEYLKTTSAILAGPSILIQAATDLLGDDEQGGLCVPGDHRWASGLRHRYHQFGTPAPDVQACNRCAGELSREVA
ncbi:hypothetical protein FB45DRAFT_878563 [Roridomyces roridus]|uniref:Uncharacterized protein n=1 Tax=Roridomyces roridus TaxID=1738132 RepID=A0AAD7B0B6_9AGAR|nr:hypothetical protein FB45DRAFT_878563 [Roridomyces roridus]